MARALQIDPRNHQTGLRDSDTGEACKAEGVVDITDDCGAPALVIYTRTLRGRIAKIDRLSTDGSVASSIHFFIDELDAEMRAEPRDDTFGSLAEKLGLSKRQLRAIIEAHAPA